MTTKDGFSSETTKSDNDIIPPFSVKDNFEVHQENNSPIYSSGKGSDSTKSVSTVVDLSKVKHVTDISRLDSSMPDITDIKIYCAFLKSIL